MIVARAPLRVSFFGGGTDMPAYYEHFGEGRVLAAATGLSVYAVVQSRWDGRLSANYTKRELVDDVSEIEHDLVRECLLASGVTTGVEVTTLADVPSEGTGLGSSSSLTVALLAAMMGYQGRMLGPLTLAEAACKIEIDRLGAPIGRQDQYTAAFGGIVLLRFREDDVEIERPEIDPISLRELSNRLLLFYTGRTRKATTILGEQRARIPEHKETLREMADQALLGAHYLYSGELDLFGALLDQAWELKRTLATGVTSQEIDDIYAVAREAGALGGKICGAGGGGFLLLYARPEDRRRVRAALKGLREVPLTLGGEGASVRCL